MYRIGLTGGIASGKSTVVAMLRRFGAAVVDCDVLARKVVEPGTKGLAAVAAAFGSAAVRPDGTMDRVYVGSVVFSDKEKKSELEGILFPLIREEIDREIGCIAAVEKKSFVFLDMPLLFEIEYQTYVDEVWLVYVDEATQLSRLMARNGFTESEATARIKSQIPAADKLSRSQVVIDNGGSVEETERRVRVQWGALMDRIAHIGENVETKEK